MAPVTPVREDLPHENQAALSISPMSSVLFGEATTEPRRVSLSSFHFGNSDVGLETQAYRARHDDTEMPHLFATDSDDIFDSGGADHEHNNTERLLNPLGISGGANPFRIPRRPVPLKKNREEELSSDKDLRSVTVADSSPETLVGEPSPRKANRWSRRWSWNLKLKSPSHTRGESSECLAMRPAPISGTGYVAIDEEAVAGGTGDGHYSPKPCPECPEPCSSHKDIQLPVGHWLIKVVVVLSLYSTVMSAIWLFVAIAQPRWGRSISSNMGLGPSSATVLTAWLAKTIELSFVTTFITFLGQVLTRRAISRGSRGATLAEMSMRSWVIQPGSMLTHCGMLRYAALTVLGVLSLIAALVAAFYTTASDAMVAPKLKYGNWEHKLMSGYVMSSYANIKYVERLCPAMLPEDSEEASSCTQVMVSGESYRNLQSFMQVWADIRKNGTTQVKDVADRPAGTASLHGNTTLLGSWIDTKYSNVTAHFEQTGRIINNVTLALPHPGVLSAATSSLNGILQPEELSGVGEYMIKAGVVSPAVNVMCVNMDKKELSPLVYTAWPHANITETGVRDQTNAWVNWTSEVPPPLGSDGKEDFLNSTVVDDIFRWGARYKRRPPVFQLYPADYNTVANSTVLGAEGLAYESIYILGKSPKIQNYTLCELRSWLSPFCSTQFNISGIAGSKMAAHCEDPNDVNGYWRSFSGDPGWGQPVGDWRWLADEWLVSSDLNGGTRNNNPANGRILTQLVLGQPSLPPYLPSMAEALAVFASPTLVLGAIGTPFHHYWEYFVPDNILGEPGAIHTFNASLTTQQYTSGHVYNWQGIFYVVLLFMFALNVLCFVYILAHAKLVTDYTEAHNLFALALNSRQNRQLKGSCGGGPAERDLAVPWKVGYTSGTNHYFFEQTTRKPWRKQTERPKSGGDLTGESYSRLSNGRVWL